VFLINENITPCTVDFSSLQVDATFLLEISKLSDQAMFRVRSATEDGVGGQRNDL
jgi:hypothetical protein